MGRATVFGIGRWRRCRDGISAVQHDALITDLFEMITLLDVKASAATARQLPDGSYEVRIEIDPPKLHAHG